jgi:divalent metal cation (Fe/Co/Zn/Cd) transporter
MYLTLPNSIIHALFNGYGKVLCESVKQLTDASDEVLVGEIVKVSRGVEGVKDVKNIRARGVGSGSLVG